MAHTLQIIILAIITIICLMILSQIILYFSLRYRFGKQTGLNKFNKQKLFVPSNTISTQKLLTNAGWSISIQNFHYLKYGLFLLSLILSYGVVLTNTEMKLDLILNDINYGRKTTETTLPENATISNYENILTLQTKDYIKELNISYTDPLIDAYIERFITGKTPYEKESIVASRILMKLTAIQTIEENVQPYGFCLFLAFFMYIFPNYAGRIKVRLSQNKKSWEILNCMSLYTVMGRLPNCKISTLIEGMMDVTSVFSVMLGRYLEALNRHDLNQCKLLRDVVDDETMRELLEQLDLANERGVHSTITVIEDMLQTQMSWLEITANKRRKMKTAITYMPVGLNLLLLMYYLMYGVMSISNMGTMIQV